MVLHQRFIKAFEEILEFCINIPEPVLYEIYTLAFPFDMSCESVMYIYIYISYSTVVVYSKDQYEIIGLSKISHSIQQPLWQFLPEKALAMHQSC